MPPHSRLRDSEECSSHFFFFCIFHMSLSVFSFFHLYLKIEQRARTHARTGERARISKPADSYNASFPLFCVLGYTRAGNFRNSSILRTAAGIETRNKERTAQKRPPSSRSDPRASASVQVQTTKERERKEERKKQPRRREGKQLNLAPCTPH